MSYDLAVWSGSVPRNAHAATVEYARRMEALEGHLNQTGGPPPPSPAISAFVAAALARFPVLNDESGDDCPWASEPLIGEAVGDVIYFPMTFSGAEYARDVLATIAQEQGLVCYDPQTEQLLPAPDATSATKVRVPAGAEMPALGGEPLMRSTRFGWIRRLFRRA